MKVLILGATGYIGTAVAERVAAAGHRVVALARSDPSASALAARGYEVARGDVREAEAVARLAREADATIHVANTQDAANPDVDAALTRAILGALEGTGKRFVATTGVWSAGDTGERFADEASGGTPLPLVAWRAPVEREVLDAARRRVGAVVISPGIAYGRAGGIPAMLVKEARERGHVRVVNGGAQEWSAVHVEDLADLYLRALDAAPGSLYFGVAPSTVRVRDLAVAASLAGGAGGRIVDWPLEEARKELGGFVEALAVHQRISAKKAERELGWKATRPSLIEEMLVGSYVGR